MALDRLSPQLSIATSSEVYSLSSAFYSSGCVISCGSLSSSTSIHGHVSTLSFKFGRPRRRARQSLVDY